jgi:glycerol-3-phosphate dehydrogenase (NAD(P)+)
VNAGIVGGGSWGTAFALALGRKGVRTKLWIREPDIFEAAVRHRENTVFLPGFKLPSPVSVHHELEEAIRDSEILFIAVPAQFCRKIFVRLRPLLEEGQSVISLTKGIEKGTLKRMSELMAETLVPTGASRIGVLSGPSFALEVAQGHPTALVLAAADPAWARKVQDRLSGLALRVYTTADVVGVELAGALKNVIAIAAGLSDAMDFGFNSRAALMTRGLAEIARLGLRLGARRETFAGLAGMGDLLLTCTGPLSRNRHVGFELGRGGRLRDIIDRMRMVAEGIATTVSARALARREDVEMPITEQVHHVLFRNKDPRRAMTDLMTRTLKEE